MSNTFCSKAWQEVNFFLSDRKIKHCCRAQPQMFPEFLSSNFINSNDEISDRRKELLIGGKPQGCIACWEQEEQSGTSYRLAHSDRKLFPKIYKNPTGNYVKNIEITFSNICDQSCLYCFPELSSIIAKERGVENRRLEYNENDLDAVVSWLEKICTKDQKIIIRFTGGEPTSNKGYYKFLEKIKTTSLVNYPLHLHTVTNNNMTPATREKVLGCLEDKVSTWTYSIAFSNESTGEVSENVRFGSNWQRWCENFEYFIEKNKFDKHVITPSLNLFTIKELPKFLKYVTETINTVNPNIKWEMYANWVTEPEVLNCHYLPKSFKKYVEESEQYIQQDWLKHIKRMIGTKTLELEKLKTWLDTENLYKAGKLNTELLMMQITEENI